MLTSYYTKHRSYSRLSLVLGLVSRAAYQPACVYPALASVAALVLARKPDFSNV